MMDIENDLNGLFNLGQTYWQQADSDSMSQQKKSDLTEAKAREKIAAITNRIRAIEAGEDELTTLRAELDNIKTSWALLHTENEQLLAKIPEGCTPADAAQLRKANHSLIDENHQLRQRIADAVDEHTNARGEPDAIYLQLHDPDETDQLNVADYKTDVTWCWHKINNNDVRYIREDLALPIPQVPTARITEQDAREICNHFIQWLNDFEDQRKATIAKWLDDEGRTLLNKLNADREQAAELTDTYVQPVPDKCDRIVWKGKYYHLPIEQVPDPLADKIFASSDKKATDRWKKCPACNHQCEQVPAVSVPDGWRLVPEWPTKEQKDAGCANKIFAGVDANLERHYVHVTHTEVQDIYERMLSAAPPAMLSASPAPTVVTPHWVKIDDIEDVPMCGDLVLWDGCDLAIDWIETEIECGTSFFSNDTEATHYLAGLVPPVAPDSEGATIK